MYIAGKRSAIQFRNSRVANDGRREADIERGEVLFLTGRNDTLGPDVVTHSQELFTSMKTTGDINGNSQSY